MWIRVNLQFLKIIYIEKAGIFDSQYNKRVKVKVRVTLEHVTKAKTGSRYI